MEGKGEGPKKGGSGKNRTHAFDFDAGFGGDGDGAIPRGCLWERKARAREREAATLCCALQMASTTVLRGILGFLLVSHTNG